jgi:hypothetical protein
VIAEIAIHAELGEPRLADARKHRHRDDERRRLQNLGGFLVRGFAGGFHHVEPA